MQNKLAPITRPNCGTIGGTKSHRWRNEKFCSACTQAKREYDKLQYQKHKEKRIKATTEYQKQNKDKKKKWQEKYRNNNIEKVKESSRLSSKRHLETGRARTRRRRASRLLNGYAPYTEAQILEVYGSVCYLCNDSINLDLPRKTGKPGWEFGLHIDHVIPIISGGPDTLENVRPSHAICNLKKGAKMSFEPELNEDLFEDDCDCEGDCLCEEFDEDALDEEELEDLDWEDS